MKIILLVGAFCLFGFIMWGMIFGLGEDVQMLIAYTGAYIMEYAGGGFFLLSILLLLAMLARKLLRSR